MAKGITIPLALICIALIALLGLYFFVDEGLHIMIIALMGLCVLFGGGLGLVQVTPSHRFRQKLELLERKADDESADTLKSLYLDVYNRYLKLSESHKANFYGRLHEVRERIEEHLKIEKQLQQVLAMPKPPAEQAQELLEKLPLQVQERYSGQVVQLLQNAGKA